MTLLLLNVSMLDTTLKNRTTYRTLMSDSSKSALHDIVKSVIDRDGTGPADTMLVNAHLAQMKMFGIRQGVEFFPQQDNLGTQRFDFIQQVIKFNKLDARLRFNLG